MSMSTSTLEIRRAASWWTWFVDCVELTKPRISAMVLVSVAVSAFVASWGQLDLVVLLHALVGTTLVAASASALNQWLERERDARMPRTADRPLPAGRLSGPFVLAFAAVNISLGTVYLAWMLNLTTAGWGLLTWLLYVWVYTPLKSLTPQNTVVGAVAGALPILIGWSATGSGLGLRAAALFFLLFLWQFPHFMAIAWIYRRQYAGAGLQMLTVVDSSGRRAGVLAVAAALVLIPVSLVPALFSPDAGAVFYSGAALLIGLAQLLCAIAFCLRRNDGNARRLLRASLIYLPAVLVLLMLVPLV